MLKTRPVKFLGYCCLVLGFVWMILDTGYSSAEYILEALNLDKFKFLLHLVYYAIISALIAWVINKTG
jgi:hypothetical protein